MRPIIKSSFQSQLFLDQKEKTISIIPFNQPNFDLSVLKSLEKNQFKEVFKQNKLTAKRDKSIKNDYQLNILTKCSSRQRKQIKTNKKYNKNKVKNNNLIKNAKSERKQFTLTQRKSNQIDSKFGYYSPIVSSPKFRRDVSHKIPFMLKTGKHLIFEKESIKKNNFNTKGNKLQSSNSKKILRQKSSQRILRITKYYR